MEKIVMQEALGMVECRGLVAMIEAADAIIDWANRLAELIQEQAITN